MKQKLIVTLSFLISLSASAADAGFKMPPGFTLLDCVTDARAADGPYAALVIHRVGNGAYEAVLYSSYVPEGQALPSGVKRQVLAANLGCYHTEARALQAKCSSPAGFELSVEQTEKSYEAKWTGGEYRFPRDFRTSCKLLN